MQLTCVAKAGLCNRMRTLLGAKELAEQTGRELAMYWESDKECGCRWQDLFEPTIRELHEKPKIGFPMTVKITELSPYERRLREATRSSNLSDVVFASYALGKLTETIRYFDSIFHPVAPIAERVSKIIATFDGPILGVHVRCGDFQKHKRLPPGFLANYFIKAIPALMREISADIIYLATDDGSERILGQPLSTRTNGIYQQFAEVLGAERIRRQSDIKLDRHQPQAIQDALVDLLVLRQCQANCGRVKSSFSELAGVGKRNLLLPI